jgi:hypothetical protein
MECRGRRGLCPLPNPCHSLYNYGTSGGKGGKRRRHTNKGVFDFRVEVLELALHGDIHLGMGARTRQQGGGRRTIDKWTTQINGFNQKCVTGQ